MGQQAAEVQRFGQRDLCMGIASCVAFKRHPEALSAVAAAQYFTISQSDLSGPSPKLTGMSKKPVILAKLAV